jgi:hypothetical protein
MELGVTFIQLCSHKGYKTNSLILKIIVMKTQKFNQVVFAILVAAMMFPVSTLNANENEMPVITDSIEMESRLEIEPWMVDDELWTAPAEKANNKNEKTELEKMEIEPWMTNDKLWGFEKNEISSFSDENREDGIEIQSWMTNDKLWKM